MNASAEIRNCEFRFKCPKNWESLQKTEDERVRFCNQCNRTVHFCKTANELQRAIIENRCVAVELTPPESGLGSSAFVMGEIAPPKYSN